MLCNLLAWAILCDAREDDCAACLESGCSGQAVSNIPKYLFCKIALHIQDKVEEEDSASIVISSLPTSAIALGKERSLGNPLSLLGHRYP